MVVVKLPSESGVALDDVAILTGTYDVLPPLMVAVRVAAGGAVGSRPTGAADGHEWSPPALQGVKSNVTPFEWRR